MNVSQKQVFLGPKSRRGSAEMYGISLSSKGTSWKVGITRQGIVFSKQFNFATHGGEKLALLRAQAWRNQIAKKNPPLARREVADQLRRNNTSGIPGIRCEKDSEGKPRRWHATTYLGPGQVATKCFAVSIWGAAQAKNLAILERRKQLARMTGKRRVHPAEASVRATPVGASALPTPITPAEVVRRHNRSGIAGVYLRRRGDGKPYLWVSRTRWRGHCLSKSFSVAEHGYLKAKALATKERQKQLVLKAKSRTVKR